MSACSNGTGEPGDEEGEYWLAGPDETSERAGDGTSDLLFKIAKAYDKLREGFDYAESALRIFDASHQRWRPLLDRLLQTGDNLLAETERAASKASGSRALFSKAAGLEDVLKAAGNTENRRVLAAIGLAEDWLVAQARKNGFDVDGFEHVVDSYAVQHVRRSHGNVTKERARGQVAITDADFHALPDVLADPDKVVFGSGSKLGRDQIGYVKEMPDGSTLVIEEIRTGRKQLALVSMRKYPPASNTDSIVSTLKPNARSNREATLKIIDRPAEGKTTLFHRQAGEPAAPVTRQHGLNSEQSRRRGRDQLARQGKQSR